jgi:N6-adenosine-specific RNA methylase IME4
MSLNEILALPVGELAAPMAHIYLWCPNALLREGLDVMKAWGFTYKSNIITNPQQIAVDIKNFFIV